MNKKSSSENHGRAQKVPSTEYPTDATMPEQVPGADESVRKGERRDERNVERDTPRNRERSRPTPQPPLGGDRADNGSD